MAARAIAPWQMGLAYVSGSFGFGIMGMAGFLVPLRAQELGAPLAVIGLIVGANSILSIVGSVPVGALSDRIGGRQLYILSTVLCGIGALLLALTDNYWVMFAVELVFGFPRTTVWIASQAYVTSLSGPLRRASVAGRLSFATSLGSLAAPLLMGASAQIIGYQMSFWLLVPIAAVYTVIGIALPDARVALGANPTAAAPARKGGPGLGGYGQAVGLLGIRGMQMAMVLTFVRIWLLVGWYTFFRVYLAGQGFSPIVIGSVEFVSNLVNTVTSLASGPASRLGSKEVVMAGTLAISGVGVVLSFPLAFIPAVYVAGGLVGIGNGVTLPLLLALIADSVPRERLGLAMGMRTSANRLASTAAPAILGIIMTSLGIPVGLFLSTLVSWVVLGWAVSVYRRDAVGSE